jgi:alcohol dehydrogenase class IV
MSAFFFETVRSVLCEVGAVKKLGQLARELGMTRVFFVTDPGVYQAGLTDAAQQSLRDVGIDVVLYHDVQADPPEAVVLAAVERAKSEKIDGVIGLGGGSSMDVAKLIAVLAISAQPLKEMYGINNVKGARLPLIQIPTTAGTGSEVTPIAIITTGATTKMGVVSKQLLPDLAILDAELTLGLPPAVTAATGIDAMVHAIEAFTTKHKKNLYSDMLAKQALQLISANLREAVHNGKNIAAREAMLVGAMLAGQAFANAPVAAVHALAYPLGGHYHIAHGLSNSLVLPPVLRFNASHAAPLYAQLLPCLDGHATRHARADVIEDCQAFILAMENLIDDVQLPKRLRDVQVLEKDLPMLAADVMLQQRLLVNNPRTVTEADALAIYRQVY